MAKRTKTPVGHIGEPNDIVYICVYLLQLAHSSQSMVVIQPNKK